MGAKGVVGWVKGGGAGWWLATPAAPARAQVEAEPAGPAWPGPAGRADHSPH